MTFPPASVLAESGLTPAALPEAGDLAALAAKSGGTMPLAGTLVFSDRDHGWIADWYLATAGGTRHWQIRGVNFDTAFRDANGALQLASVADNPLAGLVAGEAEPATKVLARVQPMALEDDGLPH